MPLPSSATITVPCVSSTVTRAARGAPLGGVVEQVGDRPLERGCGSPVTHHGSVRTSKSTVVVRRRTRVTAWATTAASSTGSTGRGGGVLAGQLDEVADQRGHLARSGRVRRRAARCATPPRAWVEASAWASRSRLVRSEVSGVRSSWPASATSWRCRAWEAESAVSIALNAIDEAGHLVAALDRDRVEPLGAGDVLDGGGEPAYGPQAVAGHRPAGQPGADHPGDAEEQHHQAEPVEHLVGRLQRLRQDQRPAAVGRAPRPRGSARRRRRTVRADQASPARRRPRTPAGADLGGRRRFCGLPRTPPVAASRNRIFTSAAPSAHGGIAVLDRASWVPALRRLRGAGVQRLVEAAQALHPHRGVRRERDPGHREAHRHRGQQGDPAGQGPPVAAAEAGQLHQVGLAQHVADAAHGVEQPRLVLGLGLAAQVADVDLEAVGGRREVEAPDLLEDEGALQHPARPAQEQLEQGELGAGQLHQPLAAAYLAGGEVHAQVGEGQVLVGVAGLGGDAAQQRAQPGEQLLEGERLGQVVVGAGVEPLDPVADGVAGGEHQDRHAVADLAQRAGGLQAVEPRHHHVHHDGVGVDPADPGERLGAVGGGGDLVAVELQRPPQRLPDGAVVLDDEDVLPGVLLGVGCAHGPRVPPGPEQSLRRRRRAVQPVRRAAASPARWP